MRKAHILRQNKEREKQFNNSYRINDKFLPNYNALHDPYLSGYFDKPQLKKHLKEMHLIKRKRKFLSPKCRPNTTEKISSREQLKDMKLPLLEDLLPKRSSKHRNP